MASSLTLTTFKTNLLSFLMDSTNAVFPDATVTEAIRLALGEYSNVLPIIAAGTVTPSANAREVSISALTGLLSVIETWFPYTAASPEYPPNVILSRVWDIGGTPYLYLDIADAADGTDVARVIYTKPHTLNGLDSASATTFPSSDDGLLLMGAAGHALISRSIDLAETTGVSAVSTPNYAAVGTRYLKTFRSELAKRQRIQK
jgi:hypothetical protein